MKVFRGKKNEEQAQKEMLVQEINRVLKECDDLELIQLVYILLLKSLEH